MADVIVGGQRVPVANIFCIGRNYAAHAAELGNAVEEEPLVFLKPTSSLVADGATVALPAHSSDVHYEGELVLLVGKGGVDVAEADALAHVAGYALGVDLTARDVQSQAKIKGHPWTLAKGFRGAAWLSSFVPASRIADPQSLHFTLSVNGEVRQRGDTALMLFPVATLLSYLSRVYGLTAGDVIYTGTPAGVGALQPGDRVTMELPGQIAAAWTVAA